MIHVSIKNRNPPSTLFFIFEYMIDGDIPEIFVEYPWNWDKLRIQCVSVCVCVSVRNQH